MFRFSLIILFFTSLSGILNCQQPVLNKLWHNLPRTIRYTPEGNEFTIINGNKRFTRALYGTHTAFRIEAGDLPEFALYMPGMGGNMQFAIKIGNTVKWLNNASRIKARYRPGTMIYEINDPLLGNDTLFIQLLALHNSEGLIIKIWANSLNTPVELLTVFGGASNKKFSRNGDIGADPESSFYLKPENCVTNKYKIHSNRFKLYFGNSDTSLSRTICGIFPIDSELKIADANQLKDIDLLLQSNQSSEPLLLTVSSVKNGTPQYIEIKNAVNLDELDYTKLKSKFIEAEEAVIQLSNRVQLKTPDPYINNFGGALSIAADGIWDGTSYQHGAIAWRIPLNGWRGAYVADLLGWSDRARKHFQEYFKAQYTEPDNGPTVPDPEKNMARQQETKGISLYTNGYISRNPGKISQPHHYDMNLVFFDQLLSHIVWTGDTAFLRESWPAIESHLKWEKRNFDQDGDGLYDAYCCIWASDALQYSDGGVTHSSAYNYRANKLAAYLAPFIGKNPKPYLNEANKILKAIKQNLWLKNLGWYAEYKDALGLKQTHPAAGLWTVYHSIDSEVPNPFEAYQTLRYVDNYIPHIPIIADGINEKLYLLSTTNWLPYTWSVNNVAFAEMYHTALAYWQGGRPEKAFMLWKSSIMESMYLGSSPGNFTQISFYDAFRGELYRDFADPIGMAARSLTEGLFGIKPNTLSGELTIIPGFPEKWDYATLNIPNIYLDYKKSENKESYLIIPRFGKQMKLLLKTFAKKDAIKSVIVNGQNILWSSNEMSVSKPQIEISFQNADTFKVEIEWEGNPIFTFDNNFKIKNNEILKMSFDKNIILEIANPQGIFSDTLLQNNNFTPKINGTPGHRIFFLKLEQNQVTWWQPIHVEIIDLVNKIPKEYNAQNQVKTYTTINLSKYYNDRVTNIFKNKYLSPRPNVPTLQLPVQGIGNWCYPMVTANIDDSGIKKIANKKGIFKTPQGIPFKIQTASNQNNILFTSLWDNYNDSVIIPLSGKANQVWLLMAGTTNPMQSRFVNGIIKVDYIDGTSTSYELINPDTWWPIEQDYYTDDFAFKIDAPKPYRLHLKTGLITNNFNDYTSIKGFTNTAIDGGAATILNMPLNPDKKLSQITVKTVANDVVIGLMGITLENTN